MRKKRNPIYVLVKLPGGRIEKYLLSKKLEKALYVEWSIHKRRAVFFKIKGNLINVPVSQYDQKGNAKIAVGQIIWVGWEKRDYGTLFTRSQFVTKEHLKKSLTDCYRYLRHDYKAASRILIWLSLLYWKIKIRFEDDPVRY